MASTRKAAKITEERILFRGTANNREKNYTRNVYKGCLKNWGECYITPLPEVIASLTA